MTGYVYYVCPTVVRFFELHTQTNNNAIFFNVI